jgi:hypothetical protein
MKVALVSTGVAVALALTAAAVKRSRDQVNERAAASRAARHARTSPSRKTASRKASAARG